MPLRAGHHLLLHLFTVRTAMYVNEFSSSPKFFSLVAVALQ